MASFDEIVSKMTAAIKGVREAVLGKDVREFIASGYSLKLPRPSHSANCFLICVS